MLQLSAFTPSIRARTRPRTVEALYKADHPRGIDRYIDFFGDGFAGDAEPTPAEAHDETLLRSLV
jgi:hypothetical protein